MQYTRTDTTKETGSDMTSLYWNSIPIGAENAISYERLCILWHANKREVRRILHELSKEDNGDCLVLIRSSHGKGFYRSSDLCDIIRYKQECTNRARNTLAPLLKINRIMKGWNTDDKD